VRHKECCANNRNGTYKWISVCGKHELYTIYGIPQTIFNMDNNRHKLWPLSGGLKRGAGGLRFRSSSCALSPLNDTTEKGQKRCSLSLTGPAVMECPGCPSCLNDTSLGIAMDNSPSSPSASAE